MSESCFEFKNQDNLNGTQPLTISGSPAISKEGYNEISIIWSES
jgi:hypothetical protein